MNRSDILDTAKEYVTKDRNKTHGKPEDIFGAIARVWSARLGVSISPAQVCILMADLKSCRAWENPSHEDNWVDLAGYAACGGELAEAEVRQATGSIDCGGGAGELPPPMVTKGTVWEAADGTTLTFIKDLWSSKTNLRKATLVNGEKLRECDEFPYHKFLLSIPVHGGVFNLHSIVKVRKVGI